VRGSGSTVPPPRAPAGPVSPRELNGKAMQPTRAATKIRCEDGIQATVVVRFNRLCLFHIIMNLAKVSRNMAIVPARLPRRLQRSNWDPLRTSGLLAAERNQERMSRFSRGRSAMPFGGLTRGSGNSADVRSAPPPRKKDPPPPRHDRISSERGGFVMGCRGVLAPVGTKTLVGRGLLLCRFD
jgi:hypothetical protein